MKSKIFLDKKAIQTFDYPTTPKRNLQLRKDNQALVITNLFPLEYLSQFHKLYNYSIEILPTISDDNFPLKRVIYNKLETELPSGFRKIIFHGNNLYACVTVEKDLNLTNIEKTVKVQNQDYSVKLKFAAEINFRNLCFNDNENQEIKHIIEKLIRFIIMRNPNVIKFKDGTMVDISTKNMNIKSVSESQGENSLEQIYRGYMTSVQITESGYFMRINDVNKIISGKSALKKILEIREENRNLNKDDLFKKINQYFSEHRTVLAKYGNLRTYRVANINFDKSPKNTNITLREKDGKETQCNLVNYYKNQYDLKIKDENQPLIEVELLKKKGPNTEQEKETIYLIPELVFLTGLEHGTNSDDNTTKRKITSKTKMRPGDKVNAIRSIFNLLNSSTNKIYTNKQGREVKIKSPKEMQELYGIKIGNNLVVNARVMPQPHLMFNHAEKFVIPNNGIFRADNPNKVMKFSNENLFYVCDSREERRRKKSL